MIVTALGAPTARAQSNDAIAGALPLAFGQTATADNTTFSRESGEPLTIGPAAPPAGCGYIASTAWWRVTGNGQPITISTVGSAPDTAIAAYQVATSPSQTPAAPSLGNLVACNNDTSGTLQSAMTFTSTRGAVYRVQVGGYNPCATGGDGTVECEDVGLLKVLASAIRPPNDDRATAAPIATGQPTSLDDNVGATTEAGEAHVCSGNPFAATIWYRWNAPAEGDAVFSSSAAYANVLPPNNTDTVLAVYRGAERTWRACNDDVGAIGGPSRVSLRVLPGEYLIQVGAHGIDGESLVGQGPVTTEVAFTVDLDLDRDGSPRPEDCDDRDPSRRPRATDVPDDGIDQDCSGADAVNLDRDGDGFPRPRDCRDDRADIHPGARDKPGDGIDQDCARGDAPYPKLDVRVTAYFRVFRTHTEFTAFTLRGVSARTRAEMRCRGRGCPLTRKVLRFAKAKKRVSLLAPVRRARLARGAIFKLRLTHRGTVGTLTTWRFRTPKLPVRQTKCLVPGAPKPSTC